MTGERSLDGQTLLAIGGSSGIGLETARRAHAEGAQVVVTGRDPDRVHRAGLELEGSIAAFDATDLERLGRFFDELAGPVDHIVVTAPGSHRPPSPAWFDVEAARRDVEGHLLLPLEVARLAGGTVLANGSLLFVGCTDRSGAGEELGFVRALTASLSVLTRYAACELAPIRVNLIAVGSLDDQPSMATSPDRAERLRRRSSVGSLVGPDDVAALAVHLMTNTAITGATFDIDGGQRLIEGAPGPTEPDQGDARARPTRSRARLAPVPEEGDRS